MEQKKLGTKRSRQAFYHFMLLPGIIFLLIFNVLPLAGLSIAFFKYTPSKGIFNSDFVGLKYFKYLFILPDGKQIIKNTMIIAAGKMFFNTIVPITFAILLNEVRNKYLKRTVQTVAYLPHFLSWVVLAPVVLFMFGLNGPINNLITRFGSERISFMSSNDWFRTILISTETWKEFGYASIIYLAALTSIDPALYESAVIDGANRWEQTWNITLPGIKGIILLSIVMTLPNILNAGFDQVYNLINPMVYKSGDIIDTWTYRVGLVDRQYSLSTAVSLIKSVVGAILIFLANLYVEKRSDYIIF